MVDQQPIGCEQFRQFCEAVSDRQRAFVCAYNFLEVVEEYETADVEERPALAALTVGKFFDPLRELLLVENVRVCACTPNDDHCQELVANADEPSTSNAAGAQITPAAFDNCARAIETAGDKPLSKDVFGELARCVCARARISMTVCRCVRHYLSSVAFRQFIETPYFHRYLQWKWIERSVIDGLPTTDIEISMIVLELIV